MSRLPPLATLEEVETLLRTGEHTLYDVEKQTRWAYKQLAALVDQLGLTVTDDDYPAAAIVTVELPETTAVEPETQARESPGDQAHVAGLVYPLLAWAQRHGDGDAQDLAAGIIALVDNLQVLHDQSRQRLVGDIARLEAELAAKQVELAEMDTPGVVGLAVAEAEEAA